MKQTMEDQNIQNRNTDMERKRIGLRIAELRKEKKWTQAQLAEQCGLHQAHIARIETGRYSVGLDTLAQVADVLGTKVELVYATMKMPSR